VQVKRLKSCSEGEQSNSQESPKHLGLIVKKRKRASFFIYNFINGAFYGASFSMELFVRCVNLYPWRYTKRWVMRKAVWNGVVISRYA